MKTIVFCLSGSNMTPRVLQSWTQLFLQAKDLDINPILRTAHAPTANATRNDLLLTKSPGSNNQQPFQGQLDPDYIMLVNHDIVFSPEDVKQLFQTLEKQKKQSVIAGAYYRSKDLHLAAANLDGQLITLDEFQKQKKPLKIMFAGLGFILIRFSALAKLSYPWFESMSTKTHYHHLQPDASFCLKLTDHGIDTYLHPKVLVLREKRVVVGPHPQNAAITIWD